MPVFAAVDIGSNSVRLKIARLSGRKLVTIDEDREVTRLGQSVFRTGQLSPSAMAHTIQVLKRFHKTSQKTGAQRVRVAATSALRDARNGQTFIDWVRSATGWHTEVVTGLEEARLIHFGLQSNMRLGKRPVMMVDIGGGSCEITISSEGHIRYTVSLPLGAVRLTEEFLQHDPPRKKELERLHGFVLRELARVSRRVQRFHPAHVVATSGTAAALATVCSGKKQQRFQPSESVPRAKVEKVTHRLEKLKISDRSAIPGIGPRRAEIIVAGATVLAHILEECKLSAFRFSPLGLRDGLLAQMAADYDRRTRQRRQIESERWDAILALGKNYRVDLKYALRVRAGVLQLFSSLKSVHGLPAEYEEWLSAAAMLHEVGIYVNRYGWHRHTHYVIANSEIFGYTVYERQLIAAIGRYLGNSLPSAQDRIIRSLRQSDRSLTPKAVLLLRLARAVNQSRGRPSGKISVRVAEDTVRISLHSRQRAHSELELWALAKERAYFRELLGRELEGLAS